MKSARLYIFLVALGWASTAYSQTTNYQVYALFVVNIAKYSAWPSLNGDLQVTVYGKSKVFEELQKQAGKNVNGHNLKVTQANELTDIAEANIIYLADGKSSSLDDIIKATQGKSVMIICEREGLYKKGAGFSFVVTDNSTLRYDINNTELEKRLIKVSKSLTALANSMI
ncbi:YfiR family protein [Chryseolinea lacunae]|uniref:YfiR family protein n=1 Tax=Chryseolinea lacunae TaxID=2801331 RepID=A0ABS1KX43_9BACT|nr:YfiR family protein [Chryseolinea lacunae]MBL0743257.1 YfiR family protein [Chryseolinea lacunae]